jgi:hypothetical protein
MNSAAAQSAPRRTRPAWSRLHGLPVAVAALVFALLLPSCNLLLGLGMAKLQFGCLPEGSLIDTPSGPVKIEDLKSGDTVTGFSGEPVCISQIHQYQENPATSRYLTVHFANGSVVSASPRHRIDSIRAVDLKAGDPCGSQTVSRVDELRGVSRSFDLLTGDAGYRIAGIPVNSMIEEMLGR